MSSMPNLVPQDLLSDEEDTNYESHRLLEELAKQLADATEQRVLGEVRTDFPHNSTVEHQFSLRATHSRHRYDFLSLRHHLDEFPVQMYGPWGFEAEHCFTTEQLQGRLRQIFADPRTKRLINQLAKLAKPDG